MSVPLVLSARIPEVAEFLARSPWIAVGLIALVGVLRIVARAVAERSRRKTLVALVTLAPPGTVLHQERGSGGPELHLMLPTASSDSRRPGQG